MVGALFDTNVLIDFLNAVPQARDEIAGYSTRAISIVTWIEVLVGATPDRERATHRFLDQFIVIDIGKEVAQRAVMLRRLHRLKLPDAVIWASAQLNDWPRVTRDSKDFPANDPGVRVPYVL